MKLRNWHTNLLIFVVTIFVIIVVSALLWIGARDGALERDFEKVTLGMSLGQVIGIMGDPTWNSECGAKMPTGLPAGCSRELGYSVVLAPINPKYFLIWFDERERVIAWSLVVSP